MTQKKTTPVSIRDSILQGEMDLRGGEKTPNDGSIAAAIGLTQGPYSRLKQRDASTPSLLHTISAAHEIGIPVDRMPDLGTSKLLRRAGGIAWRLCGAVDMARPHALRIAADGVLAGQAPDEIQERIRRMLVGRGKTPGVLDLPRLREMAQGGLVLGCVEIALSETGHEIEDEKLASELATGLRADSAVPWAPEVRVVRNVAHASFGSDPAAPFLAALLAHRLVADFMERHEHVYHVGLAGGVHCQAFVASIGAGSSPFPDPCGDKKLVFVPMLLEPFSDHRVPLAAGVVGQMAAAASALLGSRRVEALSFQPVAYLSDGELGPLDTFSIGRVREHYDDLHVAIYGCGDRGPGGWLERVIAKARFHPSATVMTDLCLTMLDEEGEPASDARGKDFVGVGLNHIRALVRNSQRLALMLATGEAKGLPITVAARAGCAGTIVCDQAAARAALQVLEKRRASGAPARASLQKAAGPGATRLAPTA